MVVSREEKLQKIAQGYSMEEVQELLELLKERQEAANSRSGWFSTRAGRVRALDKKIKDFLTFL